MKGTDEKKLVGANYLINFYREVYNLTELYASYLNILLELENKYSDTNKATEQEGNILTERTQALRFTAHKCNILYKSIVGSLKNIKESKELLKCYERIKTKFVIDRIDVEYYVIFMNRFLIKRVIKSLLETAESLASEVFDDGR